MLSVPTTRSLEVWHCSRREPRVPRQHPRPGVDGGMQTPVQSTVYGLDGAAMRARCRDNIVPGARPSICDGRNYEQPSPWSDETVGKTPGAVSCPLRSPWLRAPIPQRKGQLVARSSRRPAWSASADTLTDTLAPGHQRPFCGPPSARGAAPFDGIDDHRPSTTTDDSARTASSTANGRTRRGPTLRKTGRSGGHG